MACRTIGRFTLDTGTAQSVAAGGNVPLPNATSEGCVSCDGATVTISRAGTYLVEFAASLAPTNAGSAETQLYRNGNAVPGAHAIDTVATAGSAVSQAFSAVLTVPRNAPTATVNVKSASAADVTVAALIVTRIA